MIARRKTFTMPPVASSIMPRVEWVRCNVCEGRMRPGPYTVCSDCRLEPHVGVGNMHTELNSVDKDPDAYGIRCREN